MAEEIHSTGPDELPAAGGLSRSQLSAVLVGAVIVAVSAWIVQVDLLALFDSQATEQMWQFVAGGFPPDTSESYLFGRSLRTGLLWAVVETIAISVIGTVLGVFLAVPMALAATAPVTYSGPFFEGASRQRVLVGKALHQSARFVLSFLRSVPGLVWGFLFVTAIGLGPFAGALALGIHNAGVLGKLYADFLEDANPIVTESVWTTGCSKLEALAHGLVPQKSATIVSYTLYRWECILRSATILGFVGAGGIGYYLVISIQRLQYQKLVTAIVAVFVLVVLTDATSSRLRSHLT